MADSAWPVRFRAMDLVSAACGADSSTVSALRAWVDALPADASRRSKGGVSWHAAAHAIVALAKAQPSAARERMSNMADHRQ
jgi:hypothetical protein